MRTVLNNELVKLKEKASAESFTELTKDLHFYPDLHGGPRRDLGVFAYPKLKFDNYRE